MWEFSIIRLKQSELAEDSRMVQDHQLPKYYLPADPCVGQASGGQHEGREH